MKVSDIMSRDVASCSPSATMADAASLMWKRDCGYVPILAADGSVMGVITDRDICRAALMDGERIQDMSVLRAATKDLALVNENDHVDAALELMAERRLRRLPVVDAGSKLVGVLSLIDLARASQDWSARRAISPTRIAATLSAIGRHGPGVVLSDR
jgi:CBS domain-containing protein